MGKTKGKPDIFTRFATFVPITAPPFPTSGMQPTPYVDIHTHRRSNAPYVIDAYAVGSDGSLPAGTRQEYIRGKCSGLHRTTHPDTDRTYSMLSHRAALQSGRSGWIMQLREIQSSERHSGIGSNNKWSWQRTAACR